MKKRLLSVMLAFVLLFGSAASLPDGAFGESTSIIASADVSGDYEYTKLDDETVKIDSYNGSATTLKIPSTINKLKVTVIGKNAFQYGSFTSITIPSSIKKIESYAFYDCSELKSVTLPSSLTTIGDNAFYECTELSSIKFPSSIKNIGESAFDHTKWIYDKREKNPLVVVNGILIDAAAAKEKVRIPSGVTTIANGAFSRNNSITSISIPNSVTSMAEPLFSQCERIESISVSSENKKYCSENGILYNKKKTKLISCPVKKTNVVIPSTVTQIGEAALFNCDIESVTFPKSLRSIGDEAFSGCCMLKSVMLPKGVKTIGNYAFKYCTSLKKITIPESVTSIGYNAFYNCRNLKTATVPKSVTSIGDKAFGKRLDYKLLKDINVDGFVLRCYVGSKAEEYAAREGAVYKLIDAEAPEEFEKRGAKKISSTPFSQFDPNDESFAVYANEKNGGLYVLSKSVLYFISASTGKASKVYNFSSIESEAVNNSYVCGNKLYAVGSKYEKNVFGDKKYTYIIYIYDLNAKKLVKRMNVDIVVSAVAADTKGHIFVSDGKKIYMLSSAGKKLSEVSVGDNTVYRFTGYDEGNGNLYFEGYYNYTYTNGSGWSATEYKYNTTSLLAAKVSGNKLSFSSRYIAPLYIQYEAAQNCSSHLTDGGYLAYRCHFTDFFMRVQIGLNSQIGFIDSASLDPKKNNPSKILTLNKQNDEIGLSHIDYYSYGVRTIYNKSSDSFIVFENDNVTNQSKNYIYEYDKKGDKISEYKTLAHVFSMNKIGNNILAVERRDSKNYYLEVIPWKKATKVTITAPSKSTVVGKTIKLSAKTDSKINETIIWSSSNNKVATVSADGKVYATGAGTATITAATPGGVKTSVKITVKDNGALVSPDMKTASKGAKSINASAQDYTVRANVNNSYIYEDKDQNIWRAENIGSKIKAEKYSKGAKKLLSTYTLTPELPRFGGIYFSSDYNYVVTGQANTKFSDSVEVVRITRYTKDWKKKDHISIKGANTAIPFLSGSCRFAETGGKLYIHTSHLMYNGHQSNMTFIIDKSKMKVIKSFYEVEITALSGYVSHSFNQFIKTDGKKIFRVDHGDGYPIRGIIISSFDPDEKDAEVSFEAPITFKGEHGQNYTGASVGGFEISKNSLLIAYTKDIGSDTNHRNIYVSVTDKLFNKTNEIKLTSFTKTSNVRVSTPQLVKVSDYLFAVMWEERNLKKNTTEVKLLLIDGSGKKCSAVGTVKGRLSDCQPILCKDGCIRWYATNDTSPTFYAVKPFEIDSLHEHKFANAKVTKKATCTENGTKVLTCTICGKKKTETIAATAHKWSDWKTISSDKSKNTYTQTRKCSVCGKTQTQLYQRFAGANRYDTARLISKGSYPNGTGTVIVATGLDFHDAMVAVPLAAAYDAPLLLTTDKQVTKQTEAELKRLRAKKVIIVSTNGAVGSVVKAALAKYNPTMISGKTYFETAAKVAKTLQEKTKKAPDTIFFATNSAFADALSASPVAAIKNAPIMYLKNTGSIDKATADYLKSVKGKVKNAYIIGGDRVISNAMMKNVAKALGLTSGKTVQRVAGANRYETCVAVNKKFKSVLSSDGICVAKGLDFPDALAGGVYAAATKQALFLADGKKLLDCQNTYLKGKNAAKITVFGGTGAVPDSLVKLIAKASV